MNNILPTFKYFLITIKHKWFVCVAGIKLGVPFWRLIIHDLSKFSFKELPHYGRQFFGDQSDPKGFIKCWVHHQNLNDHHWEYWIPRTGHSRCTPPYKDLVAIPMAKGAAMEMCADWMGASRTYTGRWPTYKNWPWLEKNWSKVKNNLHPDTAAFLEDFYLAPFLLPNPTKEISGE